VDFKIDNSIINANFSFKTILVWKVEPSSLKDNVVAHYDDEFAFDLLSGQTEDMTEKCEDENQ
jgi:hypothetical protein